MREREKGENFAARSETERIPAMAEVYKNRPRNGQTFQISNQETSKLCKRKKKLFQNIRQFFFCYILIEVTEIVFLNLFKKRKFRIKFGLKHSNNQQ